jgi:hypothetical protein
MDNGGHNNQIAYDASCARRGDINEGVHHLRIDCLAELYYIRSCKIHNISEWHKSLAKRARLQMVIDCLQDFIEEGGI